MTAMYSFLYVSIQCVFPHMHNLLAAIKRENVHVPLLGITPIEIQAQVCNKYASVASEFKVLSSS